MDEAGNVIDEKKNNFPHKGCAILIGVVYGMIIVGFFSYEFFNYVKSSPLMRT